MFKHILVPMDGSATARLAMEKAKEMAKVFASRVTAVYVINPYPFAGVGTDFAYGQAEYLSAATAEAKAIVEEAKNAFEGSGVNMETSLIEASTPWRGVIQAAEATQADLIVMGSHGRSGLEKLLLGSVTQAVLTHTRVPVLVVRA